MFFCICIILDEDKKECFDFAYNMSYAKKGEHRYETGRIDL